MNKNVFIIFLLVFVLIGCGNNKVNEKADENKMLKEYLTRAEELCGLDLSYGSVEKFSDTKGGTFGEGEFRTT